MIYLDSAATSLLKPKSVSAAMLNAMQTMASPGRGSHIAAMRAADKVYECRELACRLFNFDKPERIVFTMNASHALNIAIRSVVKSGDTVCVSGYEHNSVTRTLKGVGAKIVVAKSRLFDTQDTIAAFERLVPHVDAVVCNHVSNVFGFILPVYEISKMCERYNVPFILDASQSAGIIDIDMQRLNAAFVAMPGIRDFSARREQAYSSATLTRTRFFTVAQGLTALCRICRTICPMSVKREPTMSSA